MKLTRVGIAYTAQNKTVEPYLDAYGGWGAIQDAIDKHNEHGPAFIFLYEYESEAKHRLGSTPATTAFASRLSLISRTLGINVV